MTEIERIRIRQEHLQDKIVEDPQIMGGVPTIKGTRITVSNIKGLVDGDEPVSFIAKMYDITEDQVWACVNY